MHTATHRPVPGLTLYELMHPTIHGLTPSAFRLYIALRTALKNSPARAEYMVFVHASDLVYCTGLTRRSVTRACAELRAAGVLEVEGVYTETGRQVANRYKIVLPIPDEEA